MRDTGGSIIGQLFFDGVSGDMRLPPAPLAPTKRRRETEGFGYQRGPVLLREGCADL